ncbi:MAG TPA: TonB-dependent receptor [Saprospiraceae bacterium]|nr:TonB-dependent receptor [Saprospiraceae bacterium]
MKNFTLLLLLALLPLISSAQITPMGGRPGGGGQMNAAQFNIGRFYGKVVDDETGKPLAYASVQLSGMRWDSVSKSMKPALLAGQLTEANGEFSLEGLPIRGEFTLKINYLGYANYEQKVSFGTVGGGKPGQPGGGGRPNGGGNGDRMGAMAGAVDKDLGNIRLGASSQMLKEVTVSGEASKVQLALDKKIYRVDKDNVAAGGTAEDALKNIPSLNVDIDGNLTMRNAAPQIFVDGRPTNLSIDQIPADAIDQVEVITNPSAKYDASGGGAGIVNIVLKKERKVGYNGNVRTGVDMRGRFNLGGDVNARERKVNAFIGGNFNQRRSLSSGGTDRYQLDDDLDTPDTLTNTFQNNKSENTGFFAMGRGGIDWFISNRNTLTLSGNYHGGEFNSNDDLYIRTEVPIFGRNNYSLRESSTQRNFRNFGSQISFKHLFPKDGKEWTADANFMGSRSNSSGNFLTSYLDIPRPASRQRQEGKGRNEFFTFQTDFVNPMGKGLKMEAGGRATIRKYQSENATFQNEVRTPGFADRYKFNDQVYAGYATFSQSFPKWGYQAGLRAESSTYLGTLLDTDSTFGIDYPLQLFPSAFLTYKINEEDNLQLSFTRRINRPSFFQLIPFPDFSDSLQLSRGNPNLRPEFANSLELSYQNIFSKGHNLLMSVYYKRSTNLVTRYLFEEYDPVRLDTILVSTFQNANASIAYGAEFTLKNNLWKWLDLTTNLNLYNSRVDASNVQAGLENEQFTYFIKENVSIKLPKSVTVQFNGSYQSRTAFDTGGSGGGGGGGGGGGRGGSMGGGMWGGPSSTAQGYTIPVWFVDFSIRKDLWKRTGSLTLSVQDIFRSRRTGSHSASSFFIQDTWRRRDPQLVRLNFSYRFGKFDVSLFKRKNTRSESEGMDF